MYSSDSYSGLHSTLLSQVEMKCYKTEVIPLPFSQMQIQPVVEGDGELSTQYTRQTDSKIKLLTYCKIKTVTSGLAQASAPGF